MLAITCFQTATHTPLGSEHSQRTALFCIHQLTDTNHWLVLLWLTGQRVTAPPTENTADFALSATDGCVSIRIPSGTCDLLMISETLFSSAKWLKLLILSNPWHHCSDYYLLLDPLSHNDWINNICSKWFNILLRHNKASFCSYWDGAILTSRIRVGRNVSRILIMTISWVIGPDTKELQKPFGKLLEFIQWTLSFSDLSNL